MNLFNHVLALFHAKFACNLIIRYPVFRWETSKGYVWKSEEFKCVCNQKHSRDWNLWVTHDWWLIRSATHVKHAESWRVATAGPLQDKKYSLAWQLSHNSNLRLIPLAILSHQNALFCGKVTFHIPHILYYKYPYTHER